jgi:hypothetical protein
MSLLKDNLRLGKQAIQDLNRLHITSINVAFRIGSYWKSPLGALDSFLLDYMRAESDISLVKDHARDIKYNYRQAGYTITTTDARQKATDQINDAKQVRPQILQILRGTASKNQKKSQLKQLMQQVGYKPKEYSVLWHKSRTSDADEARIRAVRKAIKFKHGNCGEKSAIAASWLLEKTKNTKKVFWVEARNWDHAWVVMGEVGKIDANDVATRPINTWDESTVVVDGWTGDWYTAKHPYNPLKSGSAANPFQLFVRKKVQQAATQIRVNEDLAWPPSFSPNFRLEHAADPNVSYETLSSTSGSDTESSIEGVADDLMDLLQELQDLRDRK